MTDANPLAPIEALLTEWGRNIKSDREDQRAATVAGKREAAEYWAGCGDMKGEVLTDLLAALAEARQAVDALVAERDGWEQRFRELQTESRVLPCDGGCVDAPEEDCSRHGRTPAELWRIIDEIRAERDAAREALGRVEALAGEWSELHRRAVGGRYKHSVGADYASARLRAALAQPATDEPRCDHPGIEHGQFSYTGVCPRCKECKFVGHGPLCVDCFTRPATDEEAGQ